MAHMLDMTNGRANIAFLGKREDVWHRLGQEMKEGQPLEVWAREAGLNWSAIKVPAVMDLAPLALGGDRYRVIEDDCFVVRSDNGAKLGYASDGYQVVQPMDVLEWFQNYIALDERFKLDVCGSLKGGRMIWATALFDGAEKIIGEDHKARLLMTTTFDGSGSTKNLATMTRGVCWNTVSTALADGGKSCVTTRHNTKFRADKVRAELARIVAGFEAYKKMAEAMAAANMAVATTEAFFKGLLDIPHDAKVDDVSTKKLNQLEALAEAYKMTVQEGTPVGTKWTALNAVTRWVDHDRATRGGASEDEARMLSSQFGSGAALKAKAVAMLQAA